MSGVEQSESIAPRLSPFAFPSDLDLRFALLVVLILSASVFLDESVWLAWPGHGNQLVAVAHECLATTGSLSPVDNPLSDLGNVPAYSRAIDACERPILDAITQWIEVGLVLLVVIAFAMYWFYPGWIIHRHRLEPIEAEDGLELRT